MSWTKRSDHKLGGPALAATIVITIGFAGLAAAPPASAQTPPLAPRTTAMVTADALPTAQIDGVAWAQAVADDTVFVGGTFTTARPAGAAPKTSTVARSNLMAYSLSTGAYTSWNPGANAAVYALAVSPDKKTLYAAGLFTKIGGVTANRIAAFDVATGALKTTFAASLNYMVKSLAVTSTTVYVGGAFASSGSATRSRLAAFDAKTGALLAWNPGADDQVQALVVTPDGKKVIAGGAFSKAGGRSTHGLAALDATTGKASSWAAAGVIDNDGTNSAILSLSTDGTNIYGSGYVYESSGNLEGVFAADPTTGKIVWVEDCHGDTYGVYANTAAVYTVGHAHDCSTVGGFPDTAKPNRVYHRALAFTNKATGTLKHTADDDYEDWSGTPGPSLYTWFPDLAPGTYTGLAQAAWTVTGSGNYVLLGGEFPSVNGTGQQGLVRLAVPSVSPHARGPQQSGSAFTPTLQASSDDVKVSWKADTDQDDQILTYTVYRGGVAVYTTTTASTFWSRPTLTWTDKDRPDGTYSYRLTAKDRDGNTVTGASVSITIH